MVEAGDCERILAVVEEIGCVIKHKAKSPEATPVAGEARKLLLNIQTSVVVNGCDALGNALGSDVNNERYGIGFLGAKSQA